MVQNKIDKQSVFINVPFDLKYENLFTAIIFSLVSLGRKPRSVLEIVDGGQGRVSRLNKLITECPYSIHDLSRVGTPPRFNMPFELGMAVATYERGGYEYLVLDKISYRVQKNLSDLKHVDEQVHGGTARGVINCIINIFGKADYSPTAKEVYSNWKKFSVRAQTIKKDNSDSLYCRTAFNQLIIVSTELAATNKFIGN